MNIRTIDLGNGARLTRVGYADSAVPAQRLGLSAAGCASIPWGAPLWCDGDGVRLGAAVWFADVNGKRLALDPIQAADYVIRKDAVAEAMHQNALAELFAAAGFARESVDLLVLTHIDGIGAAAWHNADESWSPFFPNARVLISDIELRGFVDAAANSDADGERAAWQALLDQGLVDTYSDGEEIVGGLTAQISGGHGPGHAVLHLGDGGGVPLLSIIGHLAVSPLHLVSGECAELHSDPAVAWSALRAAIGGQRMLIGPLWPTPGYGRWINDALVAGD